MKISTGDVASTRTQSRRCSQREIPLPDMVSSRASKHFSRRCEGGFFEDPSLGVALESLPGRVEDTHPAGELYSSGSALLYENALD